VRLAGAHQHWQIEESFESLIKRLRLMADAATMLQACWKAVGGLVACWREEEEQASSVWILRSLLLTAALVTAELAASAACTEATKSAALRESSRDADTGSLSLTSLSNDLATLSR